MLLFQEQAHNTGRNKETEDRREEVSCFLKCTRAP